MDKLGKQYLLRGNQFWIFQKKCYLNLQKSFENFQLVLLLLDCIVGVSDILNWIRTTMYVVAALIIEVTRVLLTLKNPCPVRGLAVDKIDISISCLLFSKVSSASLDSSVDFDKSISACILLIMSQAKSCFNRNQINYFLKSSFTH